ncbi:hypothetical protein CRENBAI_020462 [Crenichthys baileyi]|uniref:Uncharacterized protein n=1 Tax=Crenichthys baileyi TaxID=28760 RepID=A0AAV9RQ81_9TELE
MGRALMVGGMVCLACGTTPLLYISPSSTEVAMGVCWDWVLGGAGPRLRPSRVWGLCLASLPQEWGKGKPPLCHVGALPLGANCREAGQWLVLLTCSLSWDQL